jgi:DNA repair protein RecO (recombination protein O)
MDERDEGIILRARPLTETSLIIVWLTREQGLISTVAKGARRPKSTFIGKLDLYYAAHFSFQRSRRSELHNLREVQLDATHERLRHDLGWLNQAAYAGALIEHTSERETPLPHQYELLLEFLRELPKSRPTAATIFKFELNLFNLLGLAPDLEATRLTPGSKAILGNLGGEAKPPVIPSKAQVNELSRFLLGSIPDMNKRLYGIRETALNNLPTPFSASPPGPPAMLGKARRFHPDDHRSTDEIMQDLREAEQAAETGDR